MYVICYYKFIFKIHIHLESFDRTSQARFIKIAHRLECLHQNPISQSVAHRFVHPIIVAFLSPRISIFIGSGYKSSAHRRGN